MKTKFIVIVAVALLSLWVLGAATNAAAAGEVETGAPHGLAPMVLVGLAAMLVIAKLGGELFERMGQPAVLGELVGGIIIGNLVLFGFTGAEPLKTNEVIGALAEIGVIILLFEVGLESDLKEMIEVGWSSLLVATLGIIAPFFLGWGVAAYFIPDEPRLVHIFIGATLCATSVGITARVFKDLGKLATREARIILGAAVIDDVFGLMILAVVAGAIKAAATGAVVSVMDIGLIAGKALLFLIGAIAIGHFVMPRLLRGAGRLETRGVLLTLAICFCLFLSWVAAKVGLAAIVGAFAAGLVLDEVHYKPAASRKERDLQELLHPVSAFLVPIFFVLMGMKVDLRFFGRLNLLGFAATLTLAAIIGKQLCSLGVLERGVNRLAIGLGMVPRGEVGLIFAGIGATLMMPNASGGNAAVIGPTTFGAIVIMVIVTTLVTPAALKWSLESKPGGRRQ
ncbi:MAG TPA: cation:proton antiporter [Pyrinomonadaceae bacterium]|nr:cation:proton antiporter [Pyrinomonadaceae bacterium]